MENPKISVIVPVYNVEYYVEEALDSLVNQTIFNDIEIILIDDGSSDESRFIINRYEVDYDNISVLRQDNEGVSVARNHGMKYARGEYLHFMDSDDFIIHDGLEKLYNLAIKEDYDVVCSPFLRFNSEKTWQWTISRYVYGDIKENIENIRLEDYSNLTWDTFSWNKIYKREFLEKNKIQFAEGLRFQDILFLIDVFSKASKIGIIPDFAYFWRLREDISSSTQTYDTKRVNDLLTITDLLDKFLKENVHNKEILANKYLKWLLLDIPAFIDMIPKYPKEDHDFLFESLYKIYNLIPKEYTKNINSHYIVMYEMLENKDWDNLLLFSSTDYKNNPKLPEGIDEKYLQKIDFKKDALDEDLDIYVLRLSNNDKDIIIDYGLTMPYISREEDYRIKARVVSSKHEIDIDDECIERNKLHIPVDLLEYGDNSLMMTYELGAIEKESLMKTGFRKTFSYENFDVDIARGNASTLRIIKREKGNVNYSIKEVILQDESFIEFKGTSDGNIENILVKDYLDFSTFKYPINYKAIGDGNYEFSMKIHYNDLLKAPIKKWDIYLDGKFNKINLNKNFELINKMYRIHLNNYGNRFVIELIRYDAMDTISKLNNEKNKLQKDNRKLKKQNKKLKTKISQYKNRKIIKLVDSVKRIK